MPFTTYANTGPFNNNANPALAATFFNNVETFLDEIVSSIVNDTNVTANGSGSVTLKTVNLTSGSLTRIHAIGPTTVTSGGTSVSHGLGATPDFVLPVLDEGSGGSAVIGINYGGMNSSNFTAYSSQASTGNVRFLCIKF